MSEICLGRIGKDYPNPDNTHCIVVITNVENLTTERDHYLTDIIEQAKKLGGKDGFEFDQLIHYPGGRDQYLVGLALTLPCNSKVYAEMITDIEGRQRVGEIRIRCYEKDGENIIRDDDIPF